MILNVDLFQNQSFLSIFSLILVHDVDGNSQINDDLVVGLGSATLEQR
jgi:hypothetical protein